MYPTGRAPGRRRIALWTLSLAVGSAGAVVATGARAADWQRLVMPGPVIRGHADIERDCGECHQPFRRGTQRDLCLACHEKVAADVRGARGFHGRSPAVGGNDCRVCHSEHHGRDFDPVVLDEQTFDHAATDFALRGAHRAVACRDCHDAEVSHREAPNDCVGCHRDDDAHRGKLGDDCDDCHAATHWTKGEFDHAATRFPLVGAHARVDCALCHPDARYEKTPTDCVSCHRITDAHRGRFGGKCDSCHTPRDWKRSIFDHDETDFPLRGRHAQARCAACHRGVLHEEDLATDCVSCHRTDDDHQGRNGERCGDCHRPGGWSDVAFDHGRDTKFALAGAHAELECRSCHRGTAGEETMDRRCWACHREDDVHRGQEGRDCERCHDAASWSGRVFFDHGLAGFPLLGLHAAVSCEECHASPTFKDTSGRCVACHTADDVHQRRLGEGCALCHTPNGWGVWRFDHATQTDFPLRGAHAERHCHDCHTRPARGDEVRQSATCVACHATQDVHRGSFGRDCGRCHGEVGWSDARPGR